MVYKRNYQKENEYKKQPAQIKAREERNLARAHALKEGKVHKGDSLVVNHIKPLSKGGSNAKSNLSIRTAKANNSFSRTASGAIWSMGQYMKRKDKRGK